MINSADAAGWVGTTGLRILSATRDEVVAELEVQPKHLQAYGIVHGGVHAGVVETLASIGAAVDAMAAGRTVVGLENHTSFLRAVRSGKLRARREAPHPRAAEPGVGRVDPGRGRAAGRDRPRAADGARARRTEVAGERVEARV